MRLWISLFVSLFLCYACHDEVTESPVPVGRVRYSCSLNLVNEVMEQGYPQPSLDTPCGYVRCWDRNRMAGDEGWGIGGLLLVQGYEAGRYYAFDLACPYCYAVRANAAAGVRQMVMTSSGLADSCATCHSVYGMVFWGSPAPTDGPANQQGYPLRQYRANLLGDRLVVTN